MKRRVHRAHTNKHNLRVISAANQLALDAYHVLCDASFVRAVLLSYAKRIRKKQQQRHDPTSGGAVGAVGDCPFLFMRQCVEEAFRVDGGATASTSPPGPRPSSTQAVHYYYLPESEAALQRLMHGTTTLYVPPTGRPTFDRAGGAHGNQTQQGRSRQQGRLKRLLANAAETIFKKMHRIHRGRDDAQDATTTRNEAKAIAEFLNHPPAALAPHRPDGGGRAPPPPSSCRNAHYFFVATQSHDVRRGLSDQAALLRWAAQPDCVWIEAKGTTYHYADTPRRPGAAASPPQPTRASHGGPSVLSAADAAFLEHLRRQRGPAHTGDPSGPSSTRVKPDGGAVRGDSTRVGAAAPANTVSSAVVAPRKRSRSHQPNPLAIKKKQKKEVFRVD